MTDQYEWDRMMAQQLFDPTRVGDGSWDRIKAAQKAFNESEWWRDSTENSTRRILILDSMVEGR